jgi:ubiquinone/menaquinone biosynthesis C-methylase UbiE
MRSKFAGAAGQFGPAYDRRASDYAAAIEPTFRPAHRRIIELTQIGPGIRVVDLATGTGGVAREAAAAGAQVTGIDVSPGMLEIARNSSPAGITYVLAEAGTLPFPDHSFDVATCGFGLSHMPHASQVLSEVRRVLKPNSTLLASCWGRERFNPSRDAVQATLERYMPGWTDPFGQIMNEELWADPASGVRNLRDAGFDPVDIVTERLSGVFGNSAQALDRATAGPTRGAMVDAIPPAARRRFKAEAVVAIEATGNFAWWELVNYYRAIVRGGRVSGGRTVL